MAKSYLHNLLGENERILFSARQHWFILASMIALEIFVMLVIFTVSVVATIMLVNQPLAWAAPVIGFVLLLIPIISMTRDILKWSNHQYIVTNWRVIQISGFINKNIIDSSLEKVNDVKMTQSALGRIFNYGDVEILTASEIGVNLFRRLEDPVHFKTAMINAKESLEFQWTPGPGCSGYPCDDQPARSVAQARHPDRRGIPAEEDSPAGETLIDYYTPVWGALRPTQVYLIL